MTELLMRMDGPTGATASEIAPHKLFKESQQEKQKPVPNPLMDGVNWLEKHKDNMWLVISGTSYHLKQDNHPNQKNWGMGLEVKLDRDRAIVFGQYRNSIDRESHYGGLAYTPWHLGPVSFGGLFGVIDGYRPLNGKPIPMAMPLATIESKTIGVNIMAMPPIGDLSAVVGAQVKIKF